MSPGEQMRARRDAAIRLPALETGYRDPLDDHGVTYTREGVEAAVEHFKAVGMYDEFLAGILRDQWWRAAA